MARKVKKNALIEFHQVEETIWGPGPNGQQVPLASEGDWCGYTTDNEGELIFKLFVSEKDYREKFVTV